MLQIPFFKTRTPIPSLMAAVAVLSSPLSSSWAADTESSADPARLYVNDKRAPESLKDLLVIQDALQGSLAKVRAATVGIQLGEGSGSGVIVDEEGLVLTAAHVASGVDQEITVVLEDGSELPARTLGLNSVTDCGMARIVNEDGRVFPYVDLDLGDHSRLGDWVMSLGHSGGVDEARGVVVRLGRLVRIAPETINSDCKLIGGDSGGPLFDLHGQLIGIHSRVGKSLEQNMHVPLREFQKNWDAMLAGEFIGNGPFAEKPKPGTAFLGVALEDWDGDGVRVTRVGEETPAEKAELEEGDIILALDGEKTPDKETFLALIEKAFPGDHVELKVSRNDETQDIEVELEKR
jgi:serine protease Do